MYFNNKLGGVHLVKNKKWTENKKIKQLKPPKYIILPMNMHIGAEAQVVVSIGEKVKIGTLIGKKMDFISANIHSSVSGEVTKIEKKQLGNNETTVVVIKNNFKDTTVYDNLCGDSLAQLVESAGIVGMGGAGFPTNVKLALKKNQKIKTLIINAAECEPNVTADRRLIIENTTEFIKGIQKIQKKMHVKKCVIAIEESSHRTIACLKRKVASTRGIQLHILPNHYPQGAEKIVIKAVTDRELPAGKLPIDLSILLLNVSTVFAISQVIHKNKPVIERVVTVSGSPLKSPANFNVRIGTPIEHLIDACGGFKVIPGKLLNGGPMMGKLIYSLDEPVTKTTSLILALHPKESKIEKASNCIRCTSCINVCPINLQPLLIHNAYQKSDIETLKSLGVENCIDCGACTYICPSKINLVQDIRAAKVLVRNGANKR